MPPVARLARYGIARYGVLAVVAVAAWLLLPAGVGGGTTYLATHGTSMEPMFHAGDLAVVRSAAGYSVGDVVAYHSDLLDTTVLHRIVAVDGDAFTTKGDNNAWQDPDHPTEDRIIGRLWVALPHGGQALAFLRSPLGLAALGLVVTLVTGLLGRKRSSGYRRGGGVLPAGTRAAAARLTPAAAAVAAVALVGGVAAFLVPATETVDRPAQVAVRGAYTYTGAASAGVTYPDGTVTTGEPVWRALASGITVSLTRTVEDPSVTGLAGALRLDLSVATPDGWSAPLLSGATATPSGTGVSASVPLDLDAAGALVRRHYTEIHASGEGAVVTVTPVGALTGSVTGQPFAAAAPAPLTFSLDGSALTLADADGLHPKTTVDLATTATRARTVAVLGLALPVGVLRGAACLLLAAALTVLALGGAIGGPARPAVPAGFRERTVRVTAVPAATDVIEVPDVALLHRIAEQRSVLVLEHEDAAGATYLVQDGPTTYRYRSAPAAAAPTSPAPGGRHAHRRPAPTLAGLFARVAQL